MDWLTDQRFIDCVGDFTCQLFWGRGVFLVLGVRGGQHHPNLIVYQLWSENSPPQQVLAHARPLVVGNPHYPSPDKQFNLPIIVFSSDRSSLRCHVSLYIRNQSLYWSLWLWWVTFYLMWVVIMVGESRPGLVASQADWKLSTWSLASPSKPS